MIKITIDENVLTLTPRTKKLGKRLFWGWLSIQVLTAILVLGGIGFFIWAASFDSFSERKEQARQERLASNLSEEFLKTE